MNPRSSLRRPGTATAAIVFTALVMPAFVLVNSATAKGTDASGAESAVRAFDGGLAVLYLVFLIYIVAGLRTGDPASRRAALLVIPLITALKTAASAFLLVRLSLPDAESVSGPVATVVAVVLAVIAVTMLLLPASARFYRR